MGNVHKEKNETSGSTNGIPLIIRGGHHGSLRGENFGPRSTLYEGRFGRMFRAAHQGQFSKRMLTDLADQMVAKLEDPPTSENEVDDEENQGISAGYTYLGQFIDHDITFDPASSLERQNDPDALVDYRTPRFDLDSIYGRGPDDQPYLYRDNGLHMLLGKEITGNDADPNAKDVPRNQPEAGEHSRAIIGDPRNDENIMISQLHSTMLRFHNRIVDHLHISSFKEAQQMVRWHYQWVVLNDFLPVIVGDETLNHVLPHRAKNSDPLRDPPQLKFYRPKKEAFIPIEFSAAAYRFGHSMVRPIYRLNGKMTDETRLPIFSLKKESLVGNRKIPSGLAVDWSLFFDNGTGSAEKIGPKRVQPAYKIDTSLVNPLGDLPRSILPPTANKPTSLPLRNLLRGWRMQLPSGQAVAHAMGIQPIPDEELKVGKATVGNVKNKKNKPLIEVSKRFRNNAPLWYYILAEPLYQFERLIKQGRGDDATPIRLGPVGGLIVAEVFVGLMLADRHSYLRQNPLFRPIPEFTHNGEFKMINLINAAIDPNA